MRKFGEKTIRLSVLLVFLVTAFNLRANAEDAMQGQEEQSDVAYLMAIYAFGGDGTLLENAPRYSHTWAVFLKVSGRDSVHERARIDVISWLPRDGEFDMKTPPEPAALLSHEETLALVETPPLIAERVGVVEITAQLYRAAIRHREILEQNGAYKMIDDMIGRRSLAAGRWGYVNCQHAVSDIATHLGSNFLISGSRRGSEGSRYILAYMAPYIVSTGSDVEAIYERFVRDPINF